MAKWYGEIGYVEHVETSPGVYTEKVTERKYFGEVTRNTNRWSTNSDSTNDDITISNIFSIVADPFAYQNLGAMRYIMYMGDKWKITNVEFNRPRLILTVGGVYNGK